MADTHEKTESTCAEAKERYRRAMDILSESRRLSNEDIKFVSADSDNMWQFPESARDKSRPRYIVNITAQHTNQAINNMRMSRPETKIVPGGLGAHKKAGDILEGMLRSIRAASNADVAHDIAAEQCVYGGEGYWYVDTEYETDTGFDQVIKIYPIPDFNKVLIDPSARLPDKSDAEWGFMSEKISKDRCKREHPDCDPSSWVKEEYWVDKEEVIRTVYWYCEHKKEDVYLLEDGSTCYKSEHDGIVPVAKTRKGVRKQWWRCVLLGGEDEPVEKIEWPGKYLPIISSVGKETFVDGELTRKGMVRDLKDPQMIVNYSFSAAVETITLQNKIPYIASAEAIRGFEKNWGSANMSNAAYLPYNMYDAEGRQLEKPQRQEPAVMPAAQIQMLQIATEQMRAASGQNNANFGIKSEAASGVGIQRLKQQGELSTFHFPDNQLRALRYEAVVIMDLIPKIYDTRRVIRMLGIDGKESSAIIDVDMPQAHADIMEADIKAAFNPTVGIYDVVVTAGASYQTQRQEAADGMMQLVQSDPNIMQMAGDLIVKAQDWPMADKMAERLAKALPPNLQDAPEGQEPIPPQVQSQMQQMDMQMQQMQHQIQAMGDALNNAHNEVQQLEMQVQQKDLAVMKEQRARLQAEMGADQVKHVQAMQPPMPAQTQQGEPDSDEGDILPVIGELIAQTQEDNQQAIHDVARAMLAALEDSQRKLAEMLAAPKPAQIRIEKQPDGSFVGTKTEGGIDSVLHITKTDNGYTASKGI